MSHQTGIKANDELLKVFGKSQNGKLRLIKVSIVKEQLTCTATCDVKKDWEKDWDKAIPSLLEKNVPCYIFYNMDNKPPTNDNWLLINWVPEEANIRDKMVYASTKASLKQEFGTSHIKQEMHCTTLEETTLAGYQKYKQALAQPVPLTMSEQDRAEVRKNELNPDIGIETRQQTLGSIDMPTTEQTTLAVKQLLTGEYNYLQFAIDLEKELITLSNKANITLPLLPKQIPEDHARYHLYLFKHTHEGDFLESFVFIYSMPGYSCSVRERMLYSSCKAPFLEQLKAMGVDIVKKLEIESGSELTEEYLQEELHPKTIIVRQAFAKPKGPSNRGPKRLTRAQE